MTKTYSAGTDSNKHMFKLALKNCERPVIRADGFSDLPVTKKEALKFFEQNEDNLFWFFSGYPGSNLFIKLNTEVQELNRVPGNVKAGLIFVLDYMENADDRGEVFSDESELWNETDKENYYALMDWCKGL